MSDQTPPTEDIFEPSDELRRAEILKSRIRDAEIYLDEYDIRDRIRKYLNTHDVELWEACKQVEGKILTEHGKSTSDIHQSKRETWEWQEFSDNPRFDDSFEGHHIPHEEEELRRESIGQREQDMAANSPSSGAVDAMNQVIDVPSTTETVSDPDPAGGSDEADEIKITECRSLPLPFLWDSPYHIRKMFNHELTVDGVKEATFDFLDFIFEVSLFVLLIAVTGLLITATVAISLSLGGML